MLHQGLPRKALTCRAKSDASLGGSQPTARLAARLCEGVLARLSDIFRLAVLLMLRKELFKTLRRRRSLVVASALEVGRAWGQSEP